ncbi:MAG: hypothetical protein JNG89_10585 [Planctomycetaceae bacterium]|nr:hypothetical protein [Planctomycetaceae bacterium]
MRCPRCRCTKLKLGIVFAGEVACTFRDGEVVEVLDAGSLDSYWSENSNCRCMDCGWSGRVGDLQPAPAAVRTPSRRTVPAQPDRLSEIERHAVSGRCPRVIRDDVQQLVGMIRQLQKQVQILETVSRAGAMGRLVGGNDTAVF